MFLILCVQLQVWLGVFDKIIGEVAHQTAGEGGKAFNFRAFVLRHDPTQDLAGMSRVLLRHLTIVCDANPAIHAGDLQSRLIAQKGVAPPTVTACKAFQQIAVL